MQRQISLVLSLMCFSCTLPLNTGVVNVKDLYVEIEIGQNYTGTRVGEFIVDTDQECAVR